MYKKCMQGATAHMQQPCIMMPHTNKYFLLWDDPAMSTNNYTVTEHNGVYFRARSRGGAIILCRRGYNNILAPS